ncbi:hypothetical protein AK88_05496 [Plasmodium fragile]|uniref:Uncharacterized protein n=1 Tax=Plasmodium fragile TaxID=5857 RepID=A0A0D9QCT9_PLAFR|nr:uncharacterized protein AK88_05496 [Plasmodium fragile]KJP84870.1 hypothetical protein AK88_05496 [Plasmodium fragile]
MVRLPPRLKHSWRNGFIHSTGGTPWKQRLYSSSSSISSGGVAHCEDEGEGELHKYVCVVPYKNDNVLSLEKTYDAKYPHVVSENSIEVESNLKYIYKLLLTSRTVEQIRLLLHNSYCAYENNFINDVRNINWSAYIPFSSVFTEPQINVKTIKSRLFHTCMIKNIILNVIKKQQQVYIEKNGDDNILLKKKKLAPSSLQPLKIHVLFRYNELKISVNISNDLNKRLYIAHKRGTPWKQRLYSSSSSISSGGVAHCEDEGEGELHKYVCVVPYKNDNVLSLEKTYDAKYPHVVSENSIEVESNLKYIYKLLLTSRTVEQIRLLLHNSYCAYENNFINDVRNINWSAYIPFSSVFTEPQINVKTIKSRLFHTCMIKNIILNVIKKQQQVYIEKNGDDNILLKKKKLAPSSLQPLKIHVLFRYNELKISVNISNDLNKRLYIAHKSETSLKSTIIASALFKINIFNYTNGGRDLYFVDPFCNDGSILLEAFSILMTAPCGSPSINYPIVSFPMHSPSTFFEVLNEVNMTPGKFTDRVFLLGLDDSKDHIRLANANLKRLFLTTPRCVNEDDEDDVQVGGSISLSREGVDKSVRSGKGVVGKSGGGGGQSPTISDSAASHFSALCTHELNTLFSSDNPVMSRRIKFMCMDFLKLSSVNENCVIITSIINVDEKKKKKLEKILLRSQILNAFVFAPESYKERTRLKFKLISRFVSDGQNIIFVQLFGQTRRGVHDEMWDG